MKILSKTAYNKILADIEVNKTLVRSLSAENQVLNARLEAKNQILADTKKELVFYRLQAEKERDRADRAVDNLSNVSVQMPISELGLNKVTVNKKEEDDILTKQLKEVAEIYADVVASNTEAMEIS